MARHAASQSGFSLLEVMVSLVILSLASSVVAVNMMPLLDERRTNAVHDDLVAAIEQARLSSFANKRSIPLKQYLAEEHPDLAQLVRLDDDLLILPAGACQAGKIQLAQDDQVHTLELQQLTCELKRSTL